MVNIIDKKCLKSYIRIEIISIWLTNVHIGRITYIISLLIGDLRGFTRVKLSNCQSSCDFNFCSMILGYDLFIKLISCFSYYRVLYQLYLKSAER